MPIHIHPRPVRAMRERMAMPLFYMEMTGKAIVAVAFFLGLGIVPK